jgi:WD40 repeat protein
LYDAFVSYSHALDGALAPALQTGLQRFAKRWYRARALHVFRDNANLQANAGLWSSIEQALETSKWFVLLASPTAAASPWVNREVQWWRDNRDDERILVVLTEGEFTWDGEHAALPPALRGAFAEQPRWVDLRWLRNATDVDQSNPRLRECIADLAAAVRGVPKDTLIGEHIRQHRRAMRLARGGVATLVVLLVAALVASLVAFNQRNQAVTAQRQAEAAQARTEAAQHLVVARGLLAQADQLRATDPRSALQLGIAAARLSPGPITEAGLTQTLAASPYQGTLTGHTGIVDALAYSPNGKLVATGSLDSTVQLWTTGPGAPPHRVGPDLTGQTDGIRAVAISPNGHVLASGATDDTLQLWNITDPTRPTRLGPRLKFGLPVESVAFSPDGHLMAVGAGQYQPGASGSRGLLWNVADPARPRLVNAFSTGPAGSVDQVAFAGNRLLTTSIAGACTLWDISDPAHPKRGDSVTGSPAGIARIAVSPNGRLMVTSGVDGHSAQLWDTSDPTGIRRIGAPFGSESTDGVYAFSPDSRTLATAGDDHSVVLWNVGGGRPGERARLTGHTGVVDALAFSPDGSTLASGSADTTAMLWHVSGSDRPRQFSRIPVSDNGLPTPVAIAANNRTLAVGSSSGIALWDIADRRHPRGLGSVPSPPDPVTALALSPNGSTLITVADDVDIWDVSHPAHPRRLAGPLRLGDPLAEGVALADGGRLLAVAADRTTLWSLADPAHPRLLGKPFGGQASEFDVAFSPDGHTLATGAGDATIALWDVSDPARVRQVAGPFGSEAGAVYSMDYLADGRTLGVGSSGFFSLWNVADRSRPNRLGPPVTSSAELPQTAVSPDGRTAAITVGAELTVAVYDLTDTSQPRPLAQLPPTTRQVASMAFAPDSRTLATATQTGVVLWDLGPVARLRADAVATACGRSGPLGPAQWAADAPGIPYQNTCATG